MDVAVDGAGLDRAHIAPLLAIWHGRPPGHARRQPVSLVLVYRCGRHAGLALGAHQVPSVLTLALLTRSRGSLRRSATEEPTSLPASG